MNIGVSFAKPFQPQFMEEQPLRLINEGIDNVTATGVG